MKLALAEMRRNRGRFAAIIAALVLIVFLVLVLNALADGLYYGATGAIRTSGADLYVFSKDGRRQLARSTLPASSEATIAAVPGVAAVGQVGVLQGTGQGPKGTVDLALIGYTPGKPGGPSHATEGRTPRPGEQFVAAADASLKDKGIKIGDTITFSGTSRPITIVGFTSDSRYELQPTLWTTIDTWRSVRNQARPEFQGQQGDVQAFAVKLTPGASATKTAAAIDAALGRPNRNRSAERRRSWPFRASSSSDRRSTRSSTRRSSWRPSSSPCSSPSSPWKSERSSPS